MRHRLSRKTKEKRRMGKGKGASYKPYENTKTCNSLGTTAVVCDWKTGRGVHCLSQGEMMWYHILRWDDENVDVREQYPLEDEITRPLAEESGIRHPGDKEHKMTTDFLVTKEDGSLHAYSVKADRNLNKRTLEKLCLEKLYWQGKGVPFTMLYKSEINKTLAQNIRLVVEFYDRDRVFDKYSMIKHLIATKQIVVDMETQILNCEVLDRYLKQIKEIS